MASIICECRQHLEFREVTNEWDDAGMLIRSQEAVYVARCTACDRRYTLHQYSQ